VALQRKILIAADLDCGSESGDIYDSGEDNITYNATNINSGSS
jgi:hypothetical protein